VSEFSLSSSSIKREILANSDISGIRRRAENNPDPQHEQNIIEMADALERMKNTPGWVYLENYMMKIIMDAMLQDRDKDLYKGTVNILQFVDQTIKARDGIFARREKKDGVA
jgi:hypothetical protein